jgi:hypothetical protein
MNIKYEGIYMRCSASIASIVMVFLAANNVFAAISIIPDRHIVHVLPGQDAVVMYQAYNAGDEDMTITIDPKSWSGPKDPYAWMDLESDSIYVQAGQSSPIIVNISLPNDASGEMVVMLFMCYRDSGESQLNIRNGIPLYLIAKGTEDYGLQIKDVDVSYGRTGDFYDLSFMVDIKNTGNVHMVPDVGIVIKNMQGRTVNNLFLKRPNIVLRDKEHTYRLGWREPDLRNGIYQAAVTLDYDDKIEAVTKEIEFQVSGNKIEKLEILNAGD